MNTEATIAEARRLWQAVDAQQPDDQGAGDRAPACRRSAQLIGEGINVNITLLFSQQVYEEVAEAYLAGRRTWRRRRRPRHIASVASFFVSRIDTAVDKLIEERTRNDRPRRTARALRGKVAIANAKLAYQQYKRLFSGPRWEKLAAKGARPQRLLWASTGTKNPAYSDVLYVEELIGPTPSIPYRRRPSTPSAITASRATALRKNVEERRADPGELERSGISLDQITARSGRGRRPAVRRRLRQALGAVAHKRAAVSATARPADLALAPGLEKAVAAHRRLARHGKDADGSGQHDKSVWTGTDEDKLAGLASHCRRTIADLNRLLRSAEKIRKQKFTDVRPARHGRLESRARGAGRNLRAQQAGWPKLHVLEFDRSGADAGDRERDRSRQDAVHRFQQVRQHHSSRMC